MPKYSKSELINPKQNKPKRKAHDCCFNMYSKKTFCFGQDKITGRIINAPCFYNDEKVGSEYLAKCLIYKSSIKYVGE